MNFDQIAIVGLLLCMFIAFAIDRFPVEHVAITGLAAGFGLGLVPIQSVFELAETEGFLIFTYLIENKDN